MRALPPALRLRVPGQNVCARSKCIKCMLISTAGTRVESACCHDQPPAVRSAMKPPWISDWSSKLAAARRWSADSKVHARPCRRHSFGECLLSRPATCSLVYNGAAMNLRLVQRAAARRCEAVTDSRCMLVSATGARAEGACRRWRTQGACSSLQLALVRRVLACH